MLILHQGVIACRKPGLSAFSYRAQMPCSRKYSVVPVLIRRTLSTPRISLWFLIINISFPFQEQELYQREGLGVNEVHYVDNQDCIGMKTPLITVYSQQLQLLIFYICAVEFRVFLCKGVEYLYFPTERWYFYLNLELNVHDTTEQKLKQPKKIRTVTANEADSCSNGVFEVF